MRPRRATHNRRVLPVAVALGALAVGALAGDSPAEVATTLPPIKHVFVIVLENESASTTFGLGSPAPFLATDLVGQGAFVPNYAGIGHASLDNYLAMISGQAPNPATQADCTLFGNFAPGTPAADGQVIGSGCVYPAVVQTLPDQLEAANLSWRGYMDGMGADPLREPATCAHPAVGSADHTQTATPSDQYATRHNPFVYFHSIIDNQARCDAHVVPLNNLAGDLSSAATTPNFAFITPNLCNGGHDAACANGGPGGLTAVNTFLKAVVPQIQASAAYQQDGLIAVIFDEAMNDSSACCGEPTGPNTLTPGGSGPGGGVTGAVLLSRFITPGTVTQTAYNHYSLLRSVEDLFGLSYLGYAAQIGLTPFGSDIFAPVPTLRAPTPATTPAPASPTATAVCRAKHTGGAIGATTIRRHTLSFTPVRSAQLTFQVRPAGGAPRARRHSRLRACHAFSLKLPTGHGTVRLTVQAGRSHQAKSVRY